VLWNVEAFVGFEVLTVVSEEFHLLVCDAP
jgi:hypothetical protein